LFDVLENYSAYAKIRAAISTKQPFNPYFFKGPVNKETYLSELGNWFVPQLEGSGLLGQVWLQQERAPAHYTITVREFLNEVFRDKWICRGLQRLPAPLGWPPRSQNVIL
jgi:hypothetical protein